MHEIKHPQSTARISGHPLHPMLIPFPLVLFLSALVTDIVYVASGDVAWASGSRWLLAGGLATSVLAGATGLMDFFGDARIRKIGKAWSHMVGNLVVVALEALNFILRLGDDPGRVISPVGLIISAVAAAILAFTGWAGAELVYRHGVAVADDKLGEGVFGDSSAPRQR